LCLALIVYACQGTLRSPAPAPVKPQPAAWSYDDLNVAYLGHASVLIGFRGTTILTDPAFFPRIGLSLGPVTIGPKRLVEAALAPGELPRLDAVLLSHAHMDSLDRPSLRSVRTAPLLIVPERNRDLVDDLGFARVVELRWGERITVGDVVIEAIELKHWGRRWPWERWRGYNGYLLTRGGETVLFASDTAYTEAIRLLAKQRRVDAAIIGNGAYDPWIRNHADPEQVWQMFKESGARYLLPVHWDTFRLGKEPVGEAMTRLLVAAGAEADRVVVRKIGDTWTLEGNEEAPGSRIDVSRRRRSAADAVHN
jgi:L-ascorbate metabolism protein UlaG (beta-lactamase superfamily)